MVKEIKLNDNLVKHFSDNGMYIRQVETGVEYAEAIDIIPCKYTYVETEKAIVKFEENKIE